MAWYLVKHADSFTFVRFTLGISNIIFLLDKNNDEPSVRLRSQKLISDTVKSRKCL
jgi:hypothetical protein